GFYTAPKTPGIYHVVATSAAQPTRSDTVEVRVVEGSRHHLSNLFFLHHSVGGGLVIGGDMRAAIRRFNAAHSTQFALWDHGYSTEGLRDAEGGNGGAIYAVPAENANPDGLFHLWTSQEPRWAACRDRILHDHEVIAFKSCYPASAIKNAATLTQYQQWYLA